MDNASKLLRREPEYMGRVFGPRYHCELSMDNGTVEADRIDRYAQMRMVMALESIAYSLETILWAVALSSFLYLLYEGVQTIRGLKQP